MVPESPPKHHRGAFRATETPSLVTDSLFVSGIGALASVNRRHQAQCALYRRGRPERLGRLPRGQSRHPDAQHRPFGPTWAGVNQCGVCSTGVSTVARCADDRPVLPVALEAVASGPFGATLNIRQSWRQVAARTRIQAIL
jgi:hypothetical protein